jgi:hypothetical protein
MTPGEKIALFGGVIGIFVGTYYAFTYIRDYIKQGVSGPSGYLWHQVRKLWYGFKVPSINTNIGTHIRDEIAGINVPTLDISDGDEEEEEEEVDEVGDADKLTMIIQVAVASIVLLIIILFIVRSDQIARVIK